MLDPIPQLRRHGKRFVHRPTGAYPKPDSARACPQQLRPLRQRSCNPIERQMHVGFYIPLLGFYVRPTAVLRRVSLSAVDTVDRGSCGALPHVLKKRSEVKPSLAYGNPTRAVPAVRRVIGVEAPAEHVRPSVVGGARTPSRGVPMHSSRGFSARGATKKCDSTGSTYFSRCKRGVALRARTSRLRIHTASLPVNKARVAGKMVELPGLTKRRHLEKDLCLEGLT